MRNEELSKKEQIHERQKVREAIYNTNGEIVRSKVDAEYETKNLSWNIDPVDGLTFTY